MCLPVTIGPADPPKLSVLFSSDTVCESVATSTGWGSNGFGTIGTGCVAGISIPIGCCWIGTANETNIFITGNSLKCILQTEKLFSAGSSICSHNLPVTKILFGRSLCNCWIARTLCSSSSRRRSESCCNWSCCCCNKSLILCCSPTIKKLDEMNQKKLYWIYY